MNNFIDEGMTHVSVTPSPCKTRQSCPVVLPHTNNNASAEAASHLQNCPSIVAFTFFPHKFGRTAQIANMRGCTIFSGSSHPKLVDSICERLGQKPSNVELKKFSNGETSVEISSFHHPQLDDMSMFILTHEQKRRSATKMCSWCRVGAHSTFLAVYACASRIAS